MLAEKELSPGFTLRFAYSYRYDLPHLWTAGISVPLPVSRDEKQYQKIAESQANNRSISAKLESLKREIGNNIKITLIEIQEIKSQIDLFENEVIPSAKLMLESARTRFESGRRDLSAVIENQQKLLEHENSLLRFKLRHEKAIVKLARAAGGHKYLRGKAK